MLMHLSAVALSIIPTTVGMMPGVSHALKERSKGVETQNGVRPFEIKPEC